MKRKPKIKAHDFNKFLFDQVPKFDALMLDEIPVGETWIGQVSTGPWDLEVWLDDQYDKTLRAVRRLSEGAAYRDWNPIPEFTPKHVYDRIHVGTPDLPPAWDDLK